MVDMPDSFYHSYIHELLEKTKARGHDVVFITDSKDIRRGDCLFLIGCRSILSKEQLQLNKYNLVLHPSKLPEGRGSAALIWKILEGDNEFYLTLFEANTKIDSGDIYYQEKIMLQISQWELLELEDFFLSINYHMMITIILLQFGFQQNI